MNRKALHASQLPKASSGSSSTTIHLLSIVFAFVVNRGDPERISAALCPTWETAALVAPSRRGRRGHRRIPTGALRWVPMMCRKHGQLLTHLYVSFRAKTSFPLGFCFDEAQSLARPDKKQEDFCQKILFPRQMTTHGKIFLLI